MHTSARRRLDSPAAAAAPARNLGTPIPDGPSPSIAYGFGADRSGAAQFETTVTDANTKSKETYRDARELITSVKQFNQGSTLWTSYAYDPLKQIVQVIA